MFHRSAEDASPVTQSQRLGNFTLTSLVSSGALTTVHRARGAVADTAEAEYAIKRLQPKYANDPELRAVLLASGQIGLKVSSPRVMRTVAVLEEPEPFVVLEYLNGVSLQALLSAAQSPDSTGWSPEVARCAAPILCDVLSGLHALHSAGGREGTATGWVHGAPCARHIMVMPDGTGRLVDLTHVVGPGLAWSPRRDAFLTTEEMAPEQALAPAHVDARCDLFVVGSVLWQVLTGKPLFAGEDADASLRNMLRMSIPVPSEVRAAVGRALDSVCMRALQRPRQGRFASASEMATALREKAEQAGLWASREEIAAWAKRIGERPSVPTPGTALAPRSTVIGIGFNDIHQEPASGGTVPFRPARPRRPHGEHGVQRQPVAASLPAIRRPLVAAPPAPAAPTEPFFSASSTTSGVTPTSGSDEGSSGSQDGSIKPEDSFVYRRSPELAALPGPETYGRGQDTSPPWREVQPSVAPPREPPPLLSRINTKAMAIGSAAAVVLLLIALALDDELGAPRRPPEMLRHSARTAEPVPSAVTQPPSAAAPAASSPAGPEPAAPAVENNTLEALVRSTAGSADAASPSAATTPSQAQRPAEKRPSAPRLERNIGAAAPTAPAWGSAPSLPWETVEEKPKKRARGRSGEGDSLPRNPY